MSRKDPEATRAYKAAYYLAHKAEKLAYRKNYHQQHKEEENQKSRDYHQKSKLKIKSRLHNKKDIISKQSNTRNKTYRTRHQIKLRARSRAFAKDHPGYYTPYASERRARIKGAAINDLSQAQWLEILAAYHSCCAYCGKKLKTPTRDHITPIVDKGNHTVMNIVPACQPCNSHKSDGPPPVPVQPLLLTIAPPKKKRRRNSSYSTVR